MQRGKAAKQQSDRYSSFLCLFDPLHFVFLLGLVLGACVPARVPALLSYTPGPPVIVTDRIITTIAFSLTYPGGDWKVVTSETGAPPSIYLVAPDGVSFVRVHVGPADDADRPATDHQFEERAFTLDDGTLMIAILSAPAEEWDAMLEVFEQVIESVRQV